MEGSRPKLKAIYGGSPVNCYAIITLVAIGHFHDEVEKIVVDFDICVLAVVLQDVDGDPILVQGNFDIFPYLELSVYFDECSQN